MVLLVLLMLVVTVVLVASSAVSRRPGCAGRTGCLLGRQPASLS
ncbi:hypothetical protein [Streptomyces sp. adm13(2018)]|nr:hypothetical protein [Streptomyces sp. adm13(2018)]